MKVRNIISAVCRMTGVTLAQVQSRSKKNKYETTRQIIAKAGTELGFNRYLIGIGMEQTQFRMMQLLKDAELSYSIYEEFRAQTDKIIKQFKTMKENEQRKQKN